MTVLPTGPWARTPIEEQLARQALSEGNRQGISDNQPNQLRA